jgi:hypothetical protein
MRCNRSMHTLSANLQFSLFAVSKRVLFRIEISFGEVLHKVVRKRASTFVPTVHRARRKNFGHT